MDKTGVTISSAQDAARLFQGIFNGAERESIVVAYLDRERRLLATKQIEARRADVENFGERAIIEDALRLDAGGIIVASLSPGEDTSPRENDLALTRRLANSFRNLGLTLHDHLIFGVGEYQSMRSLGLL
ncbi:MAG TPA: JAB domain-containing protein [Allosphingosinicella sp.]|nr:JAB domain-containing protein [Allosphingosinicella sp.]